MTNYNEGFLGRKLDPKLEEILEKFSDELYKVTKFGADIIKLDLESESKNDRSIIATLLLRNYIELVDSISLLIKSASTDPCKPLLRICLETLFYIKYLITDDQERRASSFIVWHTHKNLKNYLKFDGRSVAHKETVAKFRKDRYLKNESEFIYDKSEEAIVNAQSLLTLPQYVEINNEYLKEHRTRKNPNWYSLFGGPKDIEQLAAHLNMQAMYEGFYRSWSHASHGTDILQGKLANNGSGGAEIIQIRYPKDAQHITHYAFILSVSLFQTFIEKRIPEKIDFFSEWYLSIRDFYMSLSSHKYLNPQ
ncbi:DUF5677 domain-containing protein [Pontibacter sp. BT731]|uniref:DUF5677 domain-containing protein n=1 Tax=Pontibacter coccineus TaxID=3063328 RepID=UPI0026E1E33D|nr:DUF5677 domain-containing protein [Pontibacter sp. BT731]MDO6390761.1 DUF5677 domain-containing protein [Pontibacter sp. BT731]